VILKVQGQPSMYLAALYSDAPMLTPYRCDACSFRSFQDATGAIHRLLKLGYDTAVEEVDW